IIIISDADNDGVHINTLMLDFFFEFLTDLITNGNVYLGLPPKYRYQTSNGKYLYIQNDNELNKFEYSQINKSLKLTDDSINLKEIINIKREYENSFNNILHQYSLSDTLLSRILVPEDGDEYLEDIIKSVGLE